MNTIRFGRTATVGALLAGMLSQMPALRHVIGLWRAPEQVASSAEWPDKQVELTDVYLFGEAGLFAARRTDDGAPDPILPGPQRAPRDAEDASITGEILLTPKATLALRFRHPICAQSALQRQVP